LLRLISFKEVEELCFNLGELKALGPDVMNGPFYRKAWSTIKEEVWQAVKKVFEESAVDESINETLITLIPKIPNPEEVGQYRPISCSNFLYKIITKASIENAVMVGQIDFTKSECFCGGKDDTR